MIIVPFIFTLMTFHEHPHLWMFYKSLDMAKRHNWPIIAQEKYFEKPSELQKKGGNYGALINNKALIDLSFIYDIPTDEDLTLISQYPIPQKMEDNFIKENGSINDAFAQVLKNRWVELEDLLDSYFSDIEQKYNEKIDAVITMCWYPSLENAAKKRNIRVITIEQGMFREPVYIKTAYFCFTNLIDNEEEIERRYINFKNISSELPVLSRKEILALMLNEDYLGYLDHFNDTPQYEAGVALGYSLLMHNLCRTFFNDEEMLYRVASEYENYLVRKHPGDPLGSTFPTCKNIDHSPSATEFILKCKRIFSLGSNVSLESAYWNKSPYCLLKFSSSYGQKTDISDKEEYSMDIGYLNFFAFCFLIPYYKVMDTEYIKWRLSDPSESEIFKKHLSFYLWKRNCDYDTLVATPPENRLDYILKCRNEVAVKKVTDELNKLQEQYNELQRQNTELRGQIAELRGQVTELQGQNTVLREQIAELQGQNAELRGQIAELQGQNAELRGQIDIIQNQYNNELAEKDRFKYLYNEVINSSSWKITKPIRKGLDLFRKHS